MFFYIHFAMSLLRIHSRNILPEIGQFFEIASYSTVSSGIIRAQKALKTDQVVRKIGAVFSQKSKKDLTPFVYTKVKARPDPICLKAEYKTIASNPQLQRNYIEEDTKNLAETTFREGVKNFVSRVQPKKHGRKEQETAGKC